MTRFILALTCVLLAGLPAVADDQREARAALEAGKIRPLAELLARVETDCRGDMLEVELDEDDDRWSYEITLVGPHGDVAELEYDASSLALLEAEGRDLAALQCVPPGTPD